jgi:hypothetical protein
MLSNHNLKHQFMKDMHYWRFRVPANGRDGQYIDLIFFFLKNHGVF